jgi:hypothetical protein
MFILSQIFVLSTIDICLQERFSLYLLVLFIDVSIPQIREMKHVIDVVQRRHSIRSLNVEKFVDVLQSTNNTLDADPALCF